MSEIARKLEIMRESLAAANLGAVRLRGVDWFSWATGGGSDVVILTAEKGVAEVLVTRDAAYVLTDRIEKARLVDEELPSDFEVCEFSWEDHTLRDRLVREKSRGLPVASDRPVADEAGLPDAVSRAKRTLLPDEWARYRRLGRDAAEAMTEVLSRATPEWTEYKLAAEGARAMWERGIHPTLTLTAGDARLMRYRHPTPTAGRLGGRAMLVFCGRRHGLYANLTRFVYFAPPTEAQRKALDDVALVEAEALRASVPNRALAEIFTTIKASYARLGHPGEEQKHHQGGTTGYLSREIVVDSSTVETLLTDTALAWNPSLAGAKIEDTIALTADGLEILTVDPQWPTKVVDGRRRPEVLVRS